MPSEAIMQVEMWHPEQYETVHVHSRHCLISKTSLCPYCKKNKLIFVEIQIKSLILVKL